MRFALCYRPVALTPIQPRARLRTIALSWSIDCRRALHSADDDPWMIDGISVNANGCYGRLGCPCAPVQKAKGSLVLAQWLMRLVRADGARADRVAFVERDLAT